MTTPEEKTKLRLRLREKIKQKRSGRSTNVQKQKLMDDFGEKMGMTPEQIKEIQKMVQKQNSKK